MLKKNACKKIRRSFLSVFLVIVMLLTVFIPVVSAASEITRVDKSFDSNGGTFSVSTGQFYQWAASVSVDFGASSWISISRPNLYLYEITIAPNTTYVERTGTVTVSGPTSPNGNSKQIVYNIRQEGKPAPPPSSPDTYESIIGSSNSLGWALLENCFGIGVLKKIQPAIKTIGIIDSTLKMTNAFVAMRDEMLRQAQEKGIDDIDIMIMDAYLSEAGADLVCFSATLATQKFIPLSRFLIDNSNNVFLKSFLSYVKLAREILEK